MPSCNTPSRAEMPHCQPPPPCPEGVDCSPPEGLFLAAVLFVVVLAGVIIGGISMIEDDGKGPQ